MSSELMLVLFLALFIFLFSPKKTFCCGGGSGNGVLHVTRQYIRIICMEKDDDQIRRSSKHKRNLIRITFFYTFLSHPAIIISIITNGMLLC